MQINVWAYLKIFTPPVWALVFAFLLLVALLFTGIRSRAAVSNDFNLMNGVALALVTLIQREYPIERRGGSTRLAFLVGCLTSFIIYAFYTADLTAR